MRLEWELAKRGYRRYAAYPAATWAGILTNSVFGFIQAYVLLAMYDDRDDIGGYDAADALTFVWLAQAMIAAVHVFGSLELRRADPQWRHRLGPQPARASAAGSAAFDYGRALYHMLFRGMPTMVVGAMVFDLTAPRRHGWLEFLLSVGLAIWISFGLRFLANVSAFWLLDYRGAGMALLSRCSGSSPGY